MKLKRIFNMELAVELIKLGHELVKVEHHKYREDQVIFRFKYDDKLDESIGRLLQENNHFKY